MIPKNISLILIIVILFSCSNQQKEVDHTISLENTLSIERKQELVTIRDKQIVAVLDTIPMGQLPVLLNRANEIIPQQWDDTNGDGIWDQLITALDFKPNEKHILKLKTISKSEIPVFKKYTNVHFGVGMIKPEANEVQTYSRQGDPRDIDSLFFQMEGPAWENDKVGFRTYFDPRNGMDIFGKTTENIVLPTVGLTDNYHELADWGMDILKVGNSLGAGAIALQQNDTLSRITGVENTEFRIVKKGPIKTTFEIIHKNTHISNQKLTIINRITIVKGQWGYHREVFFSGLEQESVLVTGIVNLKPNELMSKNFGDFNSVFSYGKQSENNDNLGMAILLKKEDDLGQENAPDDGDGIVKTYLVSMKASNLSSTSYYFLSGWELSDKIFMTKEGFESMVANTAKRLSSPIVVK